MLRRYLFLGLFSFLLMASSDSQANSFRVLPDGSGPFADLQTALAAAADGDTILLADGVFTGPANRNLVVQDMNLFIVAESGNPEQCQVDLDGANDPEGRFFMQAGGSSELQVVVQGLKISHGLYNAGACIMAEGLVLNLLDCHFLDSAVDGGYGPGGGALLIYEGSLFMDNCLLQGNETHGMPGASNHGGGLSAVDSQLEISNSRFVDNFAHGDFDAGGHGGAISTVGGHLLVDHCEFLENKVGPSMMGGSYGGAVYVYSGTADIRFSLFHENTVSGGLGGAVALYGYDDVGSATLQNCTFVHNGAGSGCIFARNGSIDLQACLINRTYTYEEGWPSEGNVAVAAWSGGEITAANCNIYGNGLDYAGPLEGQIMQNGNISLLPCFCDPELADYRLCADSWCAPENNLFVPGLLIGALDVGCAECNCPPLPAGADLPPASAQLVGAAPNPFNPRTTITFELPHQATVKIEVFDAAGRRVRQLCRQSFAAGRHEVSWQGRDDQGRILAGGMYLVQFESGTNVQSRKLMLLK